MVDSAKPSTKTSSSSHITLSSEVLDSERLPDKLGDRVMKDSQVKRPPQVRLSVSRAYTDPQTNKKIDAPNADLVKVYMFEGGFLEKELVCHMIRQAMNIFSNEPNLLRLDGKVVVVGDIHGQYYDLVAMMRKVSKPGFPNNKVLFLGDYVDRGFYGP